MISRRYNPPDRSGILVGRVRLFFWLVLLMPLSFTAVLAQNFRVTGTVVSADDGSPLPSVNVVEVGTQNGAITDFDGTFTLMVANPQATLRVSFVGFVSQNIPVEGRSEIRVELREDTQMLEEVVVTAFGIERQTRSVGYSVGQVNAEGLRQTRDPNVANALAGKVAGVLVSKTASGPAGSSRIVIRGNSALEGNNQPLYVVDGVPIDNSNLGSAGMWGGADRGDHISGVNPDDIENISVLKGPAAAALYGTRASNGVILITTKSGATTGAGVGAGLGIEFNSNLTFEDALVGYSDYQKEYGQGTRGAKPTSLDEALETGGSSWGAGLDGSPVITFDGKEHPYSLVDDKLGLFYQTGTTATNTLALTGGFQNTTFRFSGSYLTNEAIVPNGGMDRYTLTLRGSSTFGRLSADIKANYVHNDVNNRSMLSDAPGNPNYTIGVLPNNIDPRWMKPGYIVEPSGAEKELVYSNNVFSTNSYFAASRFINADKENRFIGHVLLRYAFTDWLSLQGRVGQDWYNTRLTSVTPYGTAYAQRGSMSENAYGVWERNWDFLLTASRDLTSDFGINASFGGNRMDTETERLGMSGNNFNIPGLNTISNLSGSTTGYDFSTKRINSLYGSAEFSYKDYLFLTGTARNDWSSTLPDDANSYFYPSISASFVFSDAFAFPKFLTFGKIRGSVAEVGGDTNPYRLIPTYSLLSFQHMGIPLGVLNQSSIPLADLKPSSSVGWEAGFDLRFLDNRIGLEFTYYDEETSDQILSTSVASSSGFVSKVINAGKMTNRGIEALLNLTPLRAPNYRWDLDLNFARNVNEVVELFPGLTSLNLDQVRSQQAWIVAEVGEPFSTIKGYKYKRDPDGNIVVDASGLPVRGPLEVLGVGLPDWTGGITNTLRYKNLTLSGLIHVNWGGDIYSGTNANAYGAGLHKNTLQGRAECEAAGYDSNGGLGCWVSPGVVEITNPDGTTSYTPNTTKTFPQSYWGAIPARIAEEFVYDATYVKLRELQLSFRLPNSWLRRSPISFATVSLVGRNLWLIYSKVPNVDPESNYNNSNAQGFEWAGVPHTRSIGFNINFRM